MSNSNKPGVIEWFLLLFLTLIWGFSYYFIKYSLSSFNPVQISALRMIISGVSMIPILLFTVHKIPKNKLLPIFFCGLLGSAIPAFLYPLAQTKISSSLTGIINAFTPICTYSIGIFFYQIQKENHKILGSVIALIGAIFIIIFKPTASFNAEFFYLLIAFVVPFLYGWNGNILKKDLAGIPGIPLTAMMYVMMTLVCIPIGLFSNSFSQIPIAISEGNAFYHLLGLSLLGSALAMTLFNILIQRVHILFATSVTYLMPIVTVLVGVFDGETVLWNEIAGLIFILIGVLLINKIIKFKKEKST
ncbi:MAG TPA: DMT family transporter [Saprospiraceae bacterium]|nr:DMT family transporter [Saprospiraceae bacterium]